GRDALVPVGYRRKRAPLLAPAPPRRSLGHSRSAVRPSSSCEGRWLDLENDGRNSHSAAGHVSERHARALERLPVLPVRLSRNVFRRIMKTVFIALIAATAGTAATPSEAAKLTTQAQQLWLESRYAEAEPIFRQ